MAAEVETARPPTVVIRSIAPSLTPAERRVAEAVLASPAEVAGLGIAELAERCGTSGATVVRFCRRAGFAGYSELRLALASEAGRSAAEGRVPRTVGLDVGPSDELGDIVEKVKLADSRAITDTAEHIDLAALDRAVDAVRSAARIDLYGIGASGLVAADLEQKLRRIGKAAWVATDGDRALTSAVLLGPDDLAIGISNSGASVDVVEPIQHAATTGATTVAITNHAESPLARVADVVLLTAARESTFRSGAIASRVAQLTLVDCLFIGVAQRDFDHTLEVLDRTYAAVQTRRWPMSRQRHGQT